MSIHSNYDVVIVGAGPFGALTACLIGLLDKRIKVCVLDKHVIKRRGYGLTISPDSINAINKMLQEKLNKSPSTTHASQIRSFIHFLNSWKSTVRRASMIEDELAKKGQELGITILRDEKYKKILTEENLDGLVDPSHAQKEQDSEIQALSKVFQKAKVIIGADGTHSVIRQRVMGPDEKNLVDQTNLEHFIELKYDTSAETAQSSYFEKSHAIKCEGIAFETMGRNTESNNQLKPATMHFIVGKKTYEKFAEARNDQEWTLEKLQEEAKHDPVIHKQCEKIENYLKRVKERNGTVINPKIKRLPLNIFRSAQAVKIYKGKIVALGGDAFSGAILARGVNKAFTEAPKLATAVTTFFEKQSNQAQRIEKIPQEFNDYETSVNAIFAEEKKWAKFKVFWIKSARLAFRTLVKPVYWIKTATLAFYYFMINKITSSFSYVR